MSSLKNLYKRIGIRQPAQLLNPVTVKLDTLHMPVLSSIFLLNRKLSTHYTLVDGNKHNYGYVVDRYNIIVGKHNVLKHNISKDLRERKSVDKNIKYVTTKTGLYTVPPSGVIYIDYEFASTNVKFKVARSAIYDNTYSRIATLVSDVVKGLPIGRTRYIEIRLPTNLESFETFKKIIDKSTSIVSQTITDKENMTILMLMRWIHEKQKSNTPFHNLEDSILDDTIFMFTYNTYTSIIKADLLKGLLSDNDIKTTLKSYSGTKPMMLLYIYIVHIIMAHPIDYGDATMSDSVYEKLSPFMDIASTNDLDELDLKSIVSALSNEVATKVDEIPEDSPIEVKDVVSIDSIKKRDLNPIESGNLALQRMYDNGSISLDRFEKQVKALKDTEEKLKEIEIPKEDLIVTNEESVIYKPTTTMDPSMASDKLSVMSEKYVAKVYEKETKAMIYSLQSTGVVIDSIDESVEEDILGNTKTYKVKMKLPNGTSITNDIKMPVLDEEGVFKYMGNENFMSKQKTDVPINKIDAKTVTLTSAYGKQFIRKAKNVKDDAGKAVLKQLINMSKEGDLNLLIQGEQTLIDIKIPVEYGHFMRYVKSFKHKGISYDFKHNSRFEGIDKNIQDGINKTTHTYIGRKGATYYVMDTKSIVYTYDGKKFTSTEKTLYNTLELDDSKIPIEFANVGIMGKQIPMILILAYYDGLINVLKTMGVEYKEIPVRERVPEDYNGYKVKFLDTALLISKDNYEDNMVLGGLKSLEKYTKHLTLEDVSTIDGVTNIGLDLGLTRRVFSEMNRRRDMFIDPPTRDVLLEIGEPTDYIGLLYRSSELLVTDYTRHPRHIKGSIFKASERINSMLYKELILAVKQYQDNPTPKAKISINPYSVLTAIQTDSTTTMLDDLNPINMITQQEGFTSLGLGGRSKESMSKETRSMHYSEIGTSSDKNRDSSEVGTVGGLSADPDMNSIRGIAGLSSTEDIMKAGKVFSTIALLSPGTDKDDPKRTLFAGTISGHVIPTVGQSVIPFRTGMESVIASKTSSKYAKVAKENGVVIEANKKLVTIKYESGDKKTYRLKLWTTKEEGGTVYVHRLISNLKKGDKVTPGHTIYFDDAFFEQSLFDPKVVDYKNGILLRTMFIDIDTTHEDASGISEAATKMLSSKYAKVATIVTGADSALVKMMKVGDKVDLDSKLVTIIPDYGIDTDSEGLSDETINILSNVRNQSKLAGVKGEIVKITTMYNSDKNTMSNSIKNLVRLTDDKLFEETGKEITGRVPKGYSVSGKKLPENSIVTRIYMEGVSEAKPGNKIVLCNQLKTEVSTTYSDKVRTVSGKPIHSMFGRVPVGARIVNSPDIIITSIKLQAHARDRMVNVYFNDK